MGEGLQGIDKNLTALQGKDDEWEKVCKVKIKIGQLCKVKMRNKRRLERYKWRLEKRFAR